jgi:hypothetical protein
MRRNPMPGKQAGVESEPLPSRLTRDNRLVPGPYSEADRKRLIVEIETTLAGVVAEAIFTGRDPLDLLENDSTNAADNATVWGIAGRLWPDMAEREKHVRALAERIGADLLANWDTVERLADAYSEADLDQEDVRRLIEPDD